MRIVVDGDGVPAQPREDKLVSLREEALDDGLQCQRACAVGPPRRILGVDSLAWPRNDEN